MKRIALILALLTMAQPALAVDSPQGWGQPRIAQAADAPGEIVPELKPPLPEPTQDELDRQQNIVNALANQLSIKSKNADKLSDQEWQEVEQLYKHVQEERDKQRNLSTRYFQHATPRLEQAIKEMKESAPTAENITRDLEQYKADIEASQKRLMDKYPGLFTTDASKGTRAREIKPPVKPAEMPTDAEVQKAIDYTKKHKGQTVEMGYFEDHPIQGGVMMPIRHPIIVTGRVKDGVVTWLKHPAVTTGEALSKTGTKLLAFGKWAETHGLNGLVVFFGAIGNWITPILLGIFK